MTGIDSWSTTPATNATADGGAINWAEGQPPSSVNNTARQMCADIRSRNNDLIWFQYGTGDQGAGNLAVPAVYSSGTVFTITGADVTTVYHVGRRVRAVGSSTGTIYGTISATSYSPTTTTVTCVWDSGSLSNETLTVSLSQIPVTGSPLAIKTGTWTPIDSSGASLSFTAASGQYAKVGRLITFVARVGYPVTGSGANALIGGLPFTNTSGDSFFTPCTLFTNSGTARQAYVPDGTTTIAPTDLSSTQLTNANLSGVGLRISGSYIAAS